MTRRTLLALPLAALAPANTLPEHWWQCRDESEEADWWWANRHKVALWSEDEMVNALLAMDQEGWEWI